MKNGINLFVFCAIFLFSTFSTPCRAQNATFEIEYTGFSAEAQTAFNYAADLWSNYLISDVPIKIKAHLTLLLPGQLGITFPNGQLNFSGAPVADVWYSSCLANAISGIELNTGEADMEIYLNISATWYYGLDGLTAPGQYDFVSTALHEICHGLGFLSLANKIGSEGSFGLIDSSAFSPLTTSFPWPDLDTLPSIFDYYLETDDEVRLVTFLNPSAALAAEFTGGGLYYNRPSVLEDNDGLPGRIYAPGTFTLGSSLSHWNEGTYPIGNSNELMTPQAAPGHSSHSPGPLTLAVLDDIGWEINYDTANTAINSLIENFFNIYPNPTNEFLYIDNSNNHNLTFELLDAMGKLIFEQTSSDKIIIINIKELNNGIYFIQINNAYLNELYIEKIIKY